MRKRKLLSYEAKIILGLIFIIALIFLPFNISEDLIYLETKIENFYNKYINIYPLWAQLSVLFTPFLIYFLIYQIRKNRCSYKEDIIYDMKWKWEWSKDEIVNLQCFCPYCDTELYYDTTKSNYDNLDISKLDFICENCNKVIASIPNRDDALRTSNNIKKEIKRVIRKRINKRVVK
ncbi:hypothetical protein [Halarcobacter anaerophilus]|uniref:Uncharacterized protein n=1 Tax=Halarcobacter anaerophilus TaxID=877500 RepID=A0A4Q0Y326_9BACT|nr:hypothetical protein [Halarcobacter anaerophilus]QDF27518.1 putative membrane protein [Halarcobacter anaerophilus]RXJ63875.1 hypothetical protein CRV06_02725 [Halarcobacter anaerophilus]